MDARVLALPDPAPVDLDGRPLRVVVTTGLIGDVVSRVGREAIDLTVLIGPGVDPHSYQPGAQDLVAVERADVIFVNGWNLEGGLADDLETISAGAPVVPISAGIEPLAFEAHEHAQDEGAPAETGDPGPDAAAPAKTDDDHGEIDPHVWFDIRNVIRWTENTAEVLGALDPANAGSYTANAAAFTVELEDLETRVAEKLAAVPAENRYLVTNHDSLSYFAHAYGFEVIATVIPAASTLAEPSASDLAGLIAEMEAHGVCTIFTETTVSDEVARTAAAELASCDAVRILPLYSGALGPRGSGAEDYISMIETNVDTVVAGLAEEEG